MELGSYLYKSVTTKSRTTLWTSERLNIYGDLVRSVRFIFLDNRTGETRDGVDQVGGLGQRD